MRAPASATSCSAGLSRRSITRASLRPACVQELCVAGTGPVIEPLVDDRPASPALGDRPERRQRRKQQLETPLCRVVELFQLIGLDSDMSAASIRSKKGTDG